MLPLEAVAAGGLDPALWATLSPWRRPVAIHDPRKVVLDPALTSALGGDRLAESWRRGAPNPLPERVPVIMAQRRAAIRSGGRPWGASLPGGWGSEVT